MLGKLLKTLTLISLLVVSNLLMSAPIVTPINSFLLDESSRFEQVLAAYNDGQQSDYVFIAAHRGGKENDFADQAPGNSIANIANAQSKLFDIYESDIEILLGGAEEQLVVFHDDVFDFLTNTTETDDRLNDATLSYAQSLRLTYTNNAASDEIIPTLAEFLSAAKNRIMVKFDLKSDLFTTARLTAIFQTVVDTQTTQQVLIRGGSFVLDTAKDNSFDTRMIMRRYNSEPSVADIENLVANYTVKAISIPSGASNEVIQAALTAGLIVEVHELQGVSEQEREASWQANYDQGVRQFHSFKPSLLKSYMETAGHRNIN